jgi:hypothetical protein
MTYDPKRREYHREYMRERLKVKKHYKSCQPNQRGVDILYHGCAMIDHVSKTAFFRYLGALEIGDRYKVDGVWHEVLPIDICPDLCNTKGA